MSLVLVVVGGGGSGKPEKGREMGPWHNSTEFIREGENKRVCKDACNWKEGK